ncbi:Uma2 family endonuclease [Streptomyces sp. NPDC053048]|uniref:Uma2 family endonuclease n=1 Tax=Streptomyces sp. NPDC053048 TaxID=3365694 RepID=UPI0037D77CB3
MATVEDSAKLDEMFALIDAMNVPAGYRAEIIEGEIVLNPQRDVHSMIIRLFTRALEDARGMDYPGILWDVRVDFPGCLNGFAPDVALVREGAKKTEKGLYRYQDLELVAEVVSRSSRRDDFGSKLKTYAVAEVPTYLIADPKTGLVHVFHAPRDGEYTDETTYTFTSKFTLPFPEIVVDTTSWPRD